MAITLVFRIPFETDLASPQMAQHLAERSGLTPTRTDDWDSQMGFRLVGETGAVHLFRETRDEPKGRPPSYEFSGTAIDGEDRQRVASLFGLCRAAVEFIDGRIDEKRLIDPSHSIDLP